MASSQYKGKLPYTNDKIILALQDLQTILTDIKNRKFKPFYFLYGEEAFFIDQISDYIEDNVLTEEERGFNQMTLYGRDVSVEDIVSNAKRYPMMAERQVIIVKEAQDLSRTIEKLVSYAENPQPTTLLVVCYKYKKLDKRKKLYKALNKEGVLFEGKKLYDNQISPWIIRTLKSQGYGITQKASHMLAEFLGSDLGRVSNELNKLKLILPKGTEITPEHIEENIGISKDFNNFELQNAIGEKNKLKAHRIINYFSQNPKDNPIVLTSALLFSFFSKLLQVHSLSNINDKSVATALGISPYFSKDYITAARNYSMRDASKAISLLRVMDLKSKGVDSNAIPSGDLLKEFLVKIMD